MRINRRLPNHFGSIRFLGEGRKNAYAVHMPAIATTLSTTSRIVGADATTSSVDKGVETTSATVGVEHKAASVVNGVDTTGSDIHSVGSWNRLP